MGRADILLSCQIGNGTSHLQNPRIRSGAQAQFIDGHLQKPLARIVNGTEFLDVPIGHLGVTMDLGPFKPLGLDSARLIDSLLQYPGGFAGISSRQILVLHGGHFDMNIDPVHQRTGDLGTIPLNLRDGAGALMNGVPIIPAGAGIHGSYQHKIGRIG